MACRNPKVIVHSSPSMRSAWVIVCRGDQDDQSWAWFDYMPGQPTRQSYPYYTRSHSFTGGEVLSLSGSNFPGTLSECVTPGIQGHEKWGALYSSILLPLRCCISPYTYMYLCNWFLWWTLPTSSRKTITGTRAELDGRGYAHAPFAI